MTTFNYNMTIISKDLQSNTMTVEYVPLDNEVLTASVPVSASGIIDDVLVPSTEMEARGKTLLVIPIPFADQDLVAHMKEYAPLAIWEKMIEDAQKQVTDIAIGESITVTEHSLSVIPAPLPTIEIPKVVV